MYPAAYDKSFDKNCYALSYNTVLSGQNSYDKFISDVENNIAGSIVIVTFTVEGDPIYGYLSYNGEDFYYVEDVSRDRFKGDYDDYLEYRYKYLSLIHIWCSRCKNERKRSWIFRRYP